MRDAAGIDFHIRKKWSSSSKFPIMKFIGDVEKISNVDDREAESALLKNY